MMTVDPNIPLESPTLPFGTGNRLNPALKLSVDSSVPITVGMLLVNRYRIREHLGEGGTSRVFKAADEAPSLSGVEPSPPFIAVKVLSQAFTEPAGRFAALTAHVNRLKRLAHPNIVRLFGCERDGPVTFITMEYLPGESAYAMLHRRTADTGAHPDGNRARRVIAAIADALKYAHAQGVIHGDLKPGNVIVSDDFSAKLIDFGMTRWRVRPGSDELVASGPLEATAHYASPQLIAGEEAQPSDDVFGLACIAFELLTGVYPFEGETGERTFTSAPPHWPGLTPAEYSALLHALQLKREQRTQTVHEFMAEFATPVRQPKPHWPLYCAVATGAILGVLLWITHVRTTPPPRVPQSTQPMPPVDRTIRAPTPSTAAAPTLPRQPGSVFHDCAACPALTVLPGGVFEQGAPKGERDAVPLERPQHMVQINQPFAMSINDVTVDDFRRFAEATGRDMRGCDTYDGEWRHRTSASWQNPGFVQTGSHPVVCVSWDDATALASWLSNSTGHTYRLPSASEWESAARAGSAASRPWGADSASACTMANVADRSAERRYPGWQAFPCDDGYVFTAPVGSFASNPFGLSDVLGNVLVWTQDCWVADYAGAPSDGSARSAPVCREREVRGGSWFSPPAVVKASYRNHFASDYRTSSVGIRLVRELDK